MTKSIYYYGAFKRAAQEMIDGLNGLEIKTLDDARRLLRATPDSLITPQERLVLRQERIDEMIQAYASMQTLLASEASDIIDLRRRLTGTITRNQLKINFYYQSAERA